MSISNSTALKQAAIAAENRGTVRLGIVQYKMKKPKLLISSCLLGHNVKYDGTNNILKKNELRLLEAKYELFSFCPECAGGLPTPRVACELISQDPLKIINKLGEDKTKNFINGAILFTKEE